MVNQDTLNEEITFESAQETIFEDIKNKYLGTNWENSCNVDYNTYSYKFSNTMELDIYSRIYQKKIVSQVVFNTETILLKNFLLDKDETIDDKIKEFIEFLYNLKFNYAYSKIVDTLLPNDVFKKEEKKTIAKLFIKHDSVEDCCVCMEKNTVITRCKHNVCRICLHNLIKNSRTGHVPCPMCRKCIATECFSDGESVQNHSDEDY